MSSVTDVEPHRPRRTKSVVESELDRLLRQALAGDADAWTGLIDRLKGFVYSIPRRYGLGAEDADDVFMVCFEALYRNLDRIESGNVLPRWLATTAARESLRIKRAKDRTTTDLPLDEIVAQEEIGAEEEAVRADDAFRVRAAAARMSLRCRGLLEALYADDEVSYGEISKRLEMPVGAIGPTRGRCLDKLRKMLEAEGFFG